MRFGSPAACGRLASLGSRHGTRGGDRVLLAAIRRRGGVRSACTCRRRAAGRCGSRWRGSAHSGRSCSALTRSPPASTRRRRTPPRRDVVGPMALTLDVEPDVAVGLLRGRHGDRRGRKGPPRLRVLRRPSSSRGAHRRWRWRPIRGTPTTTSADRTSTPAAPTSPCSGRWRPGYLYKPPGKGRRVTGTGAPDPQNAAHVGYIQINHLSGYAGSAGWPDWELPFLQWAEREGFEIGVCTNADLEEHPEVLGRRQPVPLGRSRRVLVQGHA